jgi:uncharacterized membrane protein
MNENKSVRDVARLSSVDAARGLIMLFMALDHVGLLIVHKHSAEYWGGLWTRYGSADHVQFALRFLSDLCAPGFFLWMGVGIALLAARRSREGWSMRAVVRFLLVRGLLLIAIGQFIETPAWIIGIIGAIAAKKAPISAPVPGGGGPIYVDISVIFALGASMILTSVLLPMIRNRSWVWIMLGVCLLFVCSALIPTATRAGDVFALSERLLLIAGQSGVVLVEYPVLPWFAITCLGVAMGQFLERGNSAMARASSWVGVVLIFAALVLRFLGGFGNTRMPREGTWIEFFNLIKYPPSMIFSLMMVGGNLLLFGLFSGIQAQTSTVGRILGTFGRAPLFFYLAHLYLFAVIGAIFFQQGTNYSVGSSVWSLGMIPLYFACAWFERLKRSRPKNSVWRML